MSLPCRDRGTGLRARSLLWTCASLAVASAAVAQEVPRVGSMAAIEFTDEYMAYVPDVGSGDPAIVAVILREQAPLAQHLMQCWEDFADRQRVTLLAPLKMKGATAEERAARIRSAVEAWKQRNGREIEGMVVLGYSLSTPLALEAALAMPDRWAGVALTPGWPVDEPLKSRLGGLKGMPVLMVYSKAHLPDRMKSKRLRADLEAAGCVIHRHVVDRGDNMQTTYHNGEAILAWVRKIVSEGKERPATTQPVTTQLTAP